MHEAGTEKFRIHRPPFVEDKIDCPNCGPGMPARLVIRGSATSGTIAACLGCRRLYPVEEAETR
jgi:hypothetical protein